MVFATDKPKPYERGLTGLRTGWLSVIPIDSTSDASTFLEHELAARDAFNAAGGSSDIVLNLSHCCLADEGNGCAFLFGPGLPALLARVHGPTGNDDIAGVLALPVALLFDAVAVAERAGASRAGFHLHAIPALDAAVSSLCGSGRRIRIGHHLSAALCAPWVFRVPTGEAVCCIIHDFGAAEALSLDIPGGRRCPGEAAAAAALRELEEETGLRIVPQPGTPLQLATARGCRYPPAIPADFAVVEAPCALLEASEVETPQVAGAFATANARITVLALGVLPPSRTPEGAPAATGGGIGGLTTPE